MSLRVVVCDRFPIIRDGLCTLLDAAPDIEVIDSTDSGIQALMTARASRPDVLITGLAVDEISGLELVRRLAMEAPECRPKVVVFAMNDSDDMIRDVLCAGANGLLIKEATRDELAAAVRVAAKGQIMLAPQVAQRLVDWFKRGDSREEELLRSVVTVLTPRERQVLVMLAGGKSTWEVADELTIGITTVRTHVYRLRCKLNVRDRTQLVSFAYRAGLMRSA